MVSILTINPTVRYMGFPSCFAHKNKSHIISFEIITSPRVIIPHPQEDCRKPNCLGNRKEIDRQADALCGLLWCGGVGAGWNFSLDEENADERGSAVSGIASGPSLTRDWAVQSWTIRPFPGFENFVPAVAYHFCLNYLPTKFLQPAKCLGAKPLLYSDGIKGGQCINF